MITPWKKFGAVLLAATLLVSTTACGGDNSDEEKGNSSTATSNTGSSDSSSTSEKKELTFWHIMVNENEGQSQAWAEAVDTFRQENPNITVKEDKTDNDAYKTKLKTALAANAAPDVFYSWGGGFSTAFVDSGIVEPLDPYVESGVIDMDAMMPNICNNFYYNDKLYGLPTDSFLGVLYCNQELFDQYHLEIPTTMDELYEVGKVFNENGITPLALGEKDKWPGLFPFGAIALRYGGTDNVTKLLNGEGNFDENEYVRQTAEELKKLVDEGIFSSSAVALTNDEAIEEFKSGRTAMWYNGNWQVSQMNMEDSPLYGKLTLTNWPAIEGAAGDQNAYVGGASATLMVSSASKYKDDAVNLAVTVSKNFSDKAYENGDILPTWRYTGDVDLPDFQVKLAEMSENAEGFCLAWDTLLDSEAAQIHSDNVQGLYAGQVTPEQYIEKMTATRK